MKETILIVTDKNDNPQDPKGKPYGWYFLNEEELCKRYCEKNGLKYKTKQVETWRRS